MQRSLDLSLFGIPFFKQLSTKTSLGNDGTVLREGYIFPLSPVWKAWEVLASYIVLVSWVTAHTHTSLPENRLIFLSFPVEKGKRLEDGPIFRGLPCFRIFAFKAWKKMTDRFIVFSGILLIISLLFALSKER